jgi:hypothetical protein
MAFWRVAGATSAVCCGAQRASDSIPIASIAVTFAVGEGHGTRID